MKILTRSFLLAGLLGCLMMLGAPSASAAPTPKTVLVLSPFQVDLSTNLIAAQAIREEFGKESDLNLDVYYEYLDLPSFPDTDYQQNIFDHLVLQRYDLPLSLLPTDSIIKNRQYSFWELNRTQINLAITSFTLMMLLVVFLGITTQRLSKARLELKNLNENLESQVQERTAALSQANHDLAQEVAERQQAEAALQESEARFRSYFELPLTGRAITSPDKGWIDVNTTLCEMLGYTKTELTQLTWAELTHPDDIPAELVQFNRVMAGEIEGYDLEKRFLCKDGHVIHTHLAIQCLRDPNRAVDYIVALILDVTGRKKMEEQLSESEERFRSLLDSQENNIMVLDFDGVHHYVNQRSVALFKDSIGARDIIGKRLHDLYPAHIADWQLTQIHQVFSAGQGMSGDFSDGMEDQARWWHLNLQPIRNASGQIAQVMVNSLDITERKRMEKELRDSEKRTATILRLSPIVIGVSTVAEGRYTDVNDAFEKVLGYSQAETIGRTSFDLNLWVDANTRSNIIHELQERGRVENLEIHLRRKSGEVFPALIFITPIDLRNTPCLLTMMMDITDRKRVEEQLRETRDALQTIIYSSPLAILTLDAEDQVTMWNPAAEGMFGWSDKQILGQADPTVPENKIKEHDALRNATLSGMSFSNMDTLRMKKDGEQFPVSLSVAPLRGQQNEVIGRLHIITDITERKKLQEELRQQATTDELTKVSNRRHFIELANSEVKRAIRLKRPPAVALIDIDHFKQINDTYGHATGDLALIAFTKICQKQIREIDVFARFGGDEFVLLFPETTQEQAYDIVERIRLALTKKPVDLEGKQVTITLSCGIASLGDEQTSFDALLNRADQALYRAKEAGRNRVVIEAEL